MQIENEIKLDYSDVLIRPKRSTLSTRKQVILEREYQWRNWLPEDMSIEFIRPETMHWSGIPIMAANMDGVGTFEIANKIAEKGLFTCLLKSYTAKELISFFDTDDYLRTNYVAMTIGITDADE